MQNKHSVAIVGASGMVGRKFLEILEEIDLNIDRLYLFASKRSAGNKLTFKNQEITILELSEENIKNRHIDYALFSAGGSISLEYAPVFAKYGAVVIDNSSAWRMQEEIPLIVPEVNPQAAFNHKGIIANPNCSTIQSVLPLQVLKALYGLKSISFTTYQAVSGSGMNGIADLNRTQKGEEANFYPYSIHNNILPQIDVFLDNGYTKEEMKMVEETRKILELPELEISATCCRVPISNCHSVSMHIELEREFDIETIKSAMETFPGITLLDNVEDKIYPLASIANNTNDVYVGRIRRDCSNPKKLHLFCVADNIRKGAATNTVQIAKLLIDRKNITQE